MAFVRRVLCGGLRREKQDPGVGKIAQRPRVRPRLAVILFQPPHNRAGQPDHHVVPVVAVFAPDVHAADDRPAAVNDKAFAVVHRQPGVGRGPHLHMGAGRQIGLDVGRALEARRGGAARAVPAKSEPASSISTRTLTSAERRLSRSAILTAYSSLSNIKTCASTLRRAFHRLDEGREKLVRRR